MIDGRIYHCTLRHPSGSVAEWFVIETVRAGKRHRASDHNYKTEAEARTAAAAECDQVDPQLYED